MSRLSVGIDLGGTNVRAALVDEAGRLVASEKAELREKAPDAVVDAIAAAVHAVVAGIPDARIGACGVGAAGQLHGETGHIVVAPNLGWRDVPFGALLTRRLGMAVRVVNDLRAAAWGEHQAGAGKGHANLFVCFVGSGVGSALVVQNRLVTGSQGFAGEFGHIKVQPNGRRCGCSELGCLEAYAGGHNLIAQMQELIDSNASPHLVRARAARQKLTPLLLEQAALANDAEALEIYERAVGFLCVAIANQVTVLNPSRLILGGGVLLNCPEMKRRVIAGVRTHASATSRKDLEILEASLGDDSGLVGAALLANEIRQA